MRNEPKFNMGDTVRSVRGNTTTRGIITGIDWDDGYGHGVWGYDIDGDGFHFENNMKRIKKNGESSAPHICPGEWARMPDGTVEQIGDMCLEEDGCWMTRSDCQYQGGHKLAELPRVPDDDPEVLAIIKAEQEADAEHEAEKLAKEEEKKRRQALREAGEYKYFVRVRYLPGRTCQPKTQSYTDDPITIDTTCRVEIAGSLEGLEGAHPHMWDLGRWAHFKKIISQHDCFEIRENVDTWYSGKGVSPDAPRYVQCAELVKARMNL